MADDKKIKSSDAGEVEKKDDLAVKNDSAAKNLVDKKVTEAPNFFDTTKDSSDEIKDEKVGEQDEKNEKAKAGKRKVIKLIKRGQAHIQSTYNNTIVSLTDQNGNILSWSTAGKCGFKGAKKATPYAAGIVVRDAAGRAVKDQGLKEVNVFVKGVGSGREGAVRALQANGLTVLGIKDVTPTPHNGCRQKKVRRV